SRWFNTTFAPRPRFAWQNGYGWFSISPADVDTAVDYIRKQKEHHTTVSLEDEFRKFLTKYKVNYDERYVWD
ncbi:MAG: transposase, partial [Verrucomicrobiota bacterium]